MSAVPLLSSSLLVLLVSPAWQKPEFQDSLALRWFLPSRLNQKDLRPSYRL
jgi:hypothetical protein